MFTRVFERLKNQEAKAACTLPNVARYQLRHTPIFDYNFRALPVVTKPLSSLLRNSPIGKSLPLLVPRFITHRVRSETSPTAPHPEINANWNFKPTHYIITNFCPYVKWISLI